MNATLLAGIGTTVLAGAWVASPSPAPPVSAPGGDVGSSLPPVELVDFAQTPASTYSDFFGQAVLLEFFAYW